MRITLYISIFLLGISSIGFAQENQNTNDTIPIIKDSTEIITQEEQPSVNSTANDSSEIFVFVEDSPSYPGGNDAMFEYLMDSIRHPQLDVYGTVYITFVVEKDGRLTNIKILRGIGFGCDKEAIRLVKGMPKWNPGKQRGRPQRVKYNLPIRFMTINSRESRKSQKKLKKIKENKVKTP